MDAGRAPGVLGCHPSDERSDLESQERTAGALSSSGQPVPVDAKPGAMPAHDRVRLHAGEGLGLSAPRTAEQDPEDPVRGPDVGKSSAGEGGELLAESHVLEDRSRQERMAERSVGRRAARRRSIEPGGMQALGEIVNGSRADVPERTEFWLGTGSESKAA